MRAPLLLTAVTLGLMACGDVADDAPTTSAEASAIVGGTLDEGDPAVLALQAGGVTFCSGALIDPQTVLTAGHCVRGSLLSPFVWAVFGADVSSAEAHRVKVARQARHPKYADEGLPYDVALLQLELPVEGVVPLPLLSEPLSAPDVGRLVRHVGFGATSEPLPTGTGRKRELTYPITRLDADFLWSGAEGQQTCSGDSGGPALVRAADGSEAIAAVVSDGPSCHEEGWDQRVDLPEVRAWIAETTATWSESPPPPASGCSAFGWNASAAPAALLVLFGVRRARRRP